jgi:N-acetyl-anhydromuramyl-L-alanine amidase AmpD
MLVMHATVGGLLSSLRWLTNPASKVSIHYEISKSGQVYQLVSDEYAAWHAGKSVWLTMGSDTIQVSSIGVELENSNSGKDPYPAVQFEAAVSLAREKVAQYNIPLRNVVRHLDIAFPPGRKTDPAGFPWDRFLARLGSGAAAYRVKRNTVASVRTGPAQNKPRVATLSGGDTWRGVQVRGQVVKLAGFGVSDIWVVGEDGRAVWSLLLEAL